MNKIQVKKEKYIENANITHVSLVDAAANGKKFYIAKCKNGGITINAPIKKTATEGEEHYIWSPVYFPNVEDTQGEMMTAEAIEKAADKFLENLKKEDNSGIDEQHDFQAENNLLVAQSYVMQKKATLWGEEIPKGTWIMKVRILDDDVWDKIEKGEITGLSMGGTAVVVEKKEAKDVMDAKEKLGFIQKMKEFMGLDEEAVEKGELKDKAKYNIAISNFFEYLYSLDSIVWDARWDNDTERIKKVFDEFASIAREVADFVSADTVDVIKCFKKIEKEKSGGEEMTKEEMQAIAKAAAKEAIEEVTKAAEPKVEPEKEVTKADMMELVKNSVAEAIKPLQAEITKKDEEITKANEKITALEKSTAGSKQSGGEETPAPTGKTVTKSYIKTMIGGDK